MPVSSSIRSPPTFWVRAGEHDSGHHRRSGASRLAGRQGQRQVARQASGIAAGNAGPHYGAPPSDVARTGDAAAWAGLCPGNHESGGKRLSNRTRKGNRWLRRALCEAAWSATRKKSCYLRVFFYRKAGKHGMRKALVATAHRMLLIAFCILRDKTEYRELGDNYFDLLHADRTRNRLVRRLQRLGHEVILTPKAEGSGAEGQPTSAAPPGNLRKRGRPCKCAERGSPCKHLT